MPEQVEHVWGWFWQLSARRRSGPEALTFGEIGEWQRVTGRSVRPEEVEMLVAMDDAFLAEVRKEQSAAAERAAEKSKVEPRRR